MKDMHTFLVTIPARDFGQDYAMVIVAEDKSYAERKARSISDDFRESREITVKEICMDKEQCVLIANTGG